MKEFMSTLYSFDYNGNKEDERDELPSNEEINLVINELSEESRSNTVKWEYWQGKRGKHLW